MIVPCAVIGFFLLVAVCSWAEIGGIQGPFSIIMFCLMLAGGILLMGYVSWILGLSGVVVGSVGIGGVGLYLFCLTVRALWNDFPRF